MTCPRKNCDNKAVISRTYGVLPCLACQQKDARHNLNRKFRIASLTRLDRTQQERDKHGKDMLQPYDRNNANSDYFKAYPEQIDTYNVREELVKQ